MKYRSRTDLVRAILEAANSSSDDGVTRTKIMYKAVLSYSQLKDYLAIMLENELLDYSGETQTYRPTAKGLRFLRTYNQMDDIMKKVKA
jgi:predicted transcriptional regulator